MAAMTYIMTRNLYDIIISSYYISKYLNNSTIKAHNEKKHWKTFNLQLKVLVIIEVKTKISTEEKNNNRNNINEPRHIHVLNLIADLKPLSHDLLVI